MNSRHLAPTFRLAPRYVAIAAVTIYSIALSPMVVALNGPVCRFEPSCSRYAIEALKRHGLIRGGVMAIRRVARCHPWGGHGLDPVPGHAAPPTP